MLRGGGLIQGPCMITHRCLSDHGHPSCNPTAVTLAVTLAAIAITLGAMPAATLAITLNATGPAPSRTAGCNPSRNLSCDPSHNPSCNPSCHSNHSKPDPLWEVVSGVLSACARRWARFRVGLAAWGMEARKVSLAIKKSPRPL